MSRHEDRIEQAIDQSKTTMTRQHFQLIADVLDYQRAGVRVLAKGKEAEHRFKELDLTAYAFANRLATTNPNFDRERFLTAAGVK